MSGFLDYNRLLWLFPVERALLAEGFGRSTVALHLDLDSLFLQVLLLVHASLGHQEIFLFLGHLPKLLLQILVRTGLVHFTQICIRICLALLANQTSSVLDKVGLALVESGQALHQFNVLGAVRRLLDDVLQLLECCIVVDGGYSVVAVAPLNYLLWLRFQCCFYGWFASFRSVVLQLVALGHTARQDRLL